MADTWVADLTHFLDKQGTIADMSSPARRLAAYFASIVAAASNEDYNDEDSSIVVRCRRRPGRKPCPEDIIASLSYPGDHLPENALHEAIRRYDEIRDELHAAMMVVIAIADDAVVAVMYGTQGDGSRSKEGDKFLARAILTLPDAIRVLTEHTQAQDTVRVTNLPLRSDKVSRNTPCPCGSGKKFKKCCGEPGRAVH